MRCRDCEQLLEEYLDGELGVRDAASVKAHLASCAGCSEAYEALAAEQALYARYERGVEVTPRLWGGIEERIGARGSVGKVGLLRQLSQWLAPLLTAPRFSPALTAALVLVAILGTAGVMRLMNGGGGRTTEVARTDPNNGGGNGVVTPQTPTAPQPSAATPTPERGATVAPVSGQEPKNDQIQEGGQQQKPERERKPPTPATQSGGAKQQLADFRQPASPQSPTPDQLIREAEQRYVAAIKMLSRDVNGKRDKLDPQTVARFDETLASIDRTIAETRRAVNAKGGDPVAVQYMLSAYAKKVEVLREMAQLETR